MDGSIYIITSFFHFAYTQRGVVADCSQRLSHVVMGAVTLLCSIGAHAQSSN